MDAYWADDSTSLHHGDCLDVMRQLPDCSVDAIVCDPPYGLANTTPAQVAETLTAWVSGDREYLPEGRGFMGRSWDAFVPPVAVWDEALRVLKPGGHLLAFAGSRTVDLMGLGIRLAGFDIRDSIQWLSGSGFPKSLNVSKDARFCQCDPVPYSHDGDVRGMRQDVQQTAESRSASEVPDLLEAVQREGAGARLGDVRAHGPSGVDGRLSGVLSHEDDGSAEPSLAGRGDAQAPEGELRRTSLRPLSAGVRLDGAVGWVRDGASASDGAVDGAPVDADRVREPHQPRPTGQPSREPRALSDERGPQAWRVWPVCAGCSKPRIPAGLGTALKPAAEPIVVARKPLQGTVAANVLQWGTGGLNIDGCRVNPGTPVGGGGNGSANVGGIMGPKTGERPRVEPHAAGRWPTNVVLDGDAAAELDAEVGTLTSGSCKAGEHGLMGYMGADVAPMPEVVGDSGGPSRFFPTFKYQAKAPTRERPSYVADDGTKIAHPTTKPVALMSWLVRLVVGGRPDAVVLEPFAGSGTTVEACRMEGVRCIAIEREADYLPLILARIERAKAEPPRAPVIYERPAGNGRDGEASAERRYAAKGGTNFAMKPGPRYDRRPPRAESLPLVDGDNPLPLFAELDDDGDAA